MLKRFLRVGLICTLTACCVESARSEVIGTLIGEGRINSLAFGPDGKSLVAASGTFVGLLQEPRPGQLVVWDIATRKTRATLTGHADGITSATYSVDGQVLASGGYDHTVKLWNPTTARLLKSSDPSIGAILSIALSPDNTRLVAGGWHGNQDGIVNEFAVIDLANDRLIATVPAHKDAVTAVLFLLDNKTIVTGSGDGSVSVWLASNFQKPRTLPVHAGGVHCMALSPDGKTLAIASGDFFSAADPKKPEGGLRLWNTATWKETFALSLPEVVFAVAFSPDGRFLAVAGTEQVTRLLDVSGQERDALRGHAGPLRSLAFSPDGTILASGSSDGTIKLWRLPRR